MKLRINPATYLLQSGIAVRYFTERDLEGKTVAPIKQIHGLPEVLKLLRGQNNDGSWGKHGGYPIHHKPMLETFKRLCILINRYEFNRENIQVKVGCEFLYSTQTTQGDFRGMLGDQYATYYTGEFTGLLIKAGYTNDERINRAQKWLLSMRQNDGGWTIPILTLPKEGGKKRLIQLTSQPSKPIEPDRTLPFSHNWTEMVLRAFTAQPNWRSNPDVIYAGRLLKSRFFKPDAYRSYHDPRYWVRFLFWWPNLLTSLETLTLLGFNNSDPDIKKAVRWFIDNQENDGSWRTSYKKDYKSKNSMKNKEEGSWVTIRIARVLKDLGITFTQLPVKPLFDS